MNDQIDIVEEELIQKMQESFSSNLTELADRIEINSLWNVHYIFIKKYEKILTKHVFNNRQKITKKKLKEIKYITNYLEQFKNKKQIKSIINYIDNVQQATLKFSIKNELYIICHNLQQLKNEQQTGNIDKQNT